MRVLAFVIVYALSLVLSATFALAKDTHVHCDSCGMHADTSSTQVLASIKVGEKTGDYSFCSLGCVFDLLEEKGDGAAIKGIKILDHASASGKRKKYIKTADAWFLYGTKRLDGSMAPFIAAFTNKTAAAAAKEDLGGELLQWAAVKAKLTEDD